MPLSAADLRFLFDRATGLVRRGLASLRSRGWRASWQRVLKQFRRVPAAQRVALYRPEPAPFAPFAVPASEAPAASIVIPVFNQSGHTLECLRALAAHPPAAAVEIIVVDDGSSDDTPTLLPQISGLRYLRRADNGGFIAACNDGAAQARGDCVVFLNNDTVPQPGWLDALLATFDRHPDAGLVGAQLLYPDGRLQEAGGIVFADGSADKIGRLQAADHPSFNHVRRVDYCSGAAFALPVSLWNEVGGFDSHYSPAFYEDTDLCMKVRAHGRRVLCAPAARVVHTEGATAGTDVRRGVKAYQVANQQKFKARWASALATQPTHDAPAAGITDRLYERTVLVIDALAPEPDRDSGSLRLVNLMQLLVEEGAHVVFLPAHPAPAGPGTRVLQALGVEAWYGPFLPAVPAWLRTHGHRFDTVMVCRHYVARGMLPLLRKYAPQARLVFDTVDLHYLREQRAAEIAGDPSRMRAARATRALELEVMARSDVTFVVSGVERELLRGDAPGATVEVVSNLHRPAPSTPGFDGRRDVLFVGGFRHPPNVDAVCWFVGSVWPRVHARAPEMRFHCIGGDVPEAVRRLGDVPGVLIHGHVPDLSPYLNGVRVSVAPLRYGAGVKGKVNQAMAHGVPVVATGCAVEGMHLSDGVDVRVADSPEAFADAVLEVHDDPVLWQRLADHGRRNVERHFSADSAREVVRRVLLRGG